MFRFLLNLRMVKTLALMYLAAVLVPATAQTMPGIINLPLAEGTAGYGVVEAGDGNSYDMSLRGPVPSTCAGNSGMLCSYIYQIKRDSLTNYHSFQPAPSGNPAPSNLDGLEPTALIVGIDGIFTAHAGSAARAASELSTRSSGAARLPCWPALASTPPVPLSIPGINRCP